MYRTTPDHLSGDIATKRAERDNERPYRKPTTRSRFMDDLERREPFRDLPGEAIPMPEAT